MLFRPSHNNSVRKVLLRSLFYTTGNGGMEDYLGLVVLVFDESLTSAEMALLPLRHQRRQKLNPSSQFLDLEGLESRAAKEQVLSGQCGHASGTGGQGGGVNVAAGLLQLRREL